MFSLGRENNILIKKKECKGLNGVKCLLRLTVNILTFYCYVLIFFFSVTVNGSVKKLITNIDPLLFITIVLES